MFGLYSHTQDFSDKSAVSSEDLGKGEEGWVKPGWAVDGSDLSRFQDVNLFWRDDGLEKSCIA